MLDKDFFNQYQKQLLWFANTKFGRWFLCIAKDIPKEKKITRVLANGFSWDNKTCFYNNPKLAKNVNNLFKWLPFYAEKEVKIGGEWYLKPVIGLTTSTFYSTPSTSVSGYAARTGVNEVFGTIRGGAGTFNSYDVGGNGIRIRLIASSTSNQYQILGRGIFLFDTAALPDTDTVSAAQVELYCGEKNVGLGAFEIDIVASTPASNTALANADFAQTGTTIFSSVASGSITADTYNVFTLNAGGISAISKTGMSKFGGRLNWDTDNSFGGAWSSGAESSGLFSDGGAASTTQDPKLVVTHAASSAIKTVDGLAKASVKTVNGLAIASVKNINGLA